MTWTPVWGAGGDTRTDTEQAEWLADKIPAYGDYAKEAAEVLRKQARELASLRAEKERAEAERDEAIRMRDRHAEASKAQNEDITALMAERDAALKDAERYRFIRAGKSGTYNTILIHAGSQLDAAIDAARKGEQ